MEGEREVAEQREEAMERSVQIEDLRRSHYVERLLGVSPIASPRSKTPTSQREPLVVVAAAAPAPATPKLGSSLRRSALQQRHRSQRAVTPQRNAAADARADTPASTVSDAEYFTPKILRAAEARLADYDVVADAVDADVAGIDDVGADDAGRVAIETKELEVDVRLPDPRVGSVRLKRAKSPTQSPKRTGNHFWFGCGKLKKKVEGIRAKTMRLRAEISSRSIKDKIVPHPDNWIKANMPKAKIEPVTDEHAYWHGCAKCAWELKQHMRIHRDAQQVLAADDRKVKERRDDTLYLV
jgi:hypothetical protein